jgi:hypothetical protein
MTEQEWLAHDDPAPMLEFVAGRASERSLRLFLGTCCARAWEAAARRGSETWAGLRHGSLRMIRNALTLVERFADGLRGREALQSARHLTEEAEDIPASIDYGAESGVDGVADAVPAAATRRLTPESAVAAWRQALAALQYHSRTVPAGASPELPAELHRDMASWLRDVVGNPFRPVEVDPAWLSRGDGTVVRVAESIYAYGSFSELPILADALEDAGCADAAILGHCRGPGPHTRGCWVLDLFIEAPRRFALVAAVPEPEEERPPAAVAPALPASPRPPLRPGDWLCPGCHTHNFARRDTCLRCQRARPSPRLREGDWICPACNAHNFARRQSCHQCKGARPRADA